MHQITIVDQDDRVIGSATRPAARRAGQIHRIIRILLFNSQGLVLIQRRAANKTDSAGKWDTAVAGHVDTGESYDQAAAREAKEEIGLTLDSLQRLGKFYSEQAKPDGMSRRFTMLYAAMSDEPITIQPDEVAAVGWIKPADLAGWADRRPDDFTHGSVHSYQLARSRGLMTDDLSRNKR